MNNTPIPKHESIIDFNIKDVREAILKFAEINLGSDFSLTEQNDIFGSYVFIINKSNSWNGFSTGNMNITLNDMGSEKTKILVETFNTSQNHYVNVRDLSEAQRDFLQSLAKILSGDYVIESVKVKKGEGCLGLFLILFSLVFIINIMVLILV